MDSIKLGFIGAGNMTSSLVRGLLATGKAADSILVADIDQAKLAQLEQECGVQVSSNQDIAESADVIVLAVKPQ